MNRSGHRHDLRPFAHSHVFADGGVRRRERSLLWVTLLTLVTMLGELAAGWWSGSLALTADGWHMGTHALALGGAVLAYRLSARAAQHRAVPGGRTGYAFGGWKIEVLTAYTSGLFLLGVAAWLVVDSVSALRGPHVIAYAEALTVAVVGLTVNLFSAWLLSHGAGGDAGHGHAHAHGHGHDHGHGHGPAHAPAREAAHRHGPAQAAAPAPPDGRAHAGHHDHNFRAAYVHVLADAFTSVLAIGALIGAWRFDAPWLDPVVALLGAGVIAHWSLGVLRGSAAALVDATEDPALSARIRDRIESDGDAKLVDLHVWQVGAQAWSAVVTIVADRPLEAAAYRDRLHDIAGLRHVTVEVHRCQGGVEAPH